MEPVQIDEVTASLASQLEQALARLALAADSGLPTYSLEPAAQKLAAKLKSSYTLFGSLTLYKDVTGPKEYYPEQNLPMNLFVAYAALCKQCHEALEVDKQESLYFAKIANNLYVNLSDLPKQEVPVFKIKIEGDTIMGVRADLFTKLPTKTQNILTGGKDNE